MVGGVCPRCDRPMLERVPGGMRCVAGHETPILGGFLWPEPEPEAEPPPEPPPGRPPPRELRPLAVAAADIRLRPLQWLWHGRLPFGKLAIIDGDPGLGKSLVTLDIAARLSSGRPLPGAPEGATLPPLAVVMLNAEDGEADTIGPRLAAAGADASRVHLLRGVVHTGTGDERPATFPSCIAPLAELVERVCARLVVIDPLMAHLDQTVVSHNDQSVRRALLPLKEMAESTGCAVVFVRHLNKAAGLGAVYRGGGSIGIIGAARTGLLVAADPADKERRLLAAVKSNLAAPPATLAYRIGGDPPSVTWEGEVTLRAEDLLGGSPAAAAGEDPAVRAAITWLQTALASGPAQALTVQGQAAARGFSAYTIRTASRRLGVRRHRAGFGKNSHWVWSLPGADPAEGAPVHAS